MKTKSMINTLFICVSTTIELNYSHEQKEYNKFVNIFSIMVKNNEITLNEIKNELTKLYSTVEYKEKAIEKFCEDVTEKVEYLRNKY